MKKLLLLTGAIIALGGITSCSDDNVASLDPVTTQAEENTPVSFGTYLGNAKDTRAGKSGMITTANLKGTDAGFGVFAYNTETSKFEAAATAAETKNSASMKPDFMYNQKVSWKETNSETHAGEWTYSPVKFWPNPTNDESLTPKPQYVTYLAYAPYVDLSSDNKTADRTYGITGFLVSGPKLNTQFTDIAKTGYSDMMVQYNRKASPDGGSVDLLWGTAGSNGKAISVKDDGYTGDGSELDNSGQTYSGTGGTTNTTKVNADLSKMNTADKVQFRFKHALGGFGGSPEGPINNSGSGLLIDYYADEAWVSGNTNRDGSTNEGAVDTKHTRVMVNYIAVEFMSNDQNGNDDSYNIIPQKGVFDLLTGQWWLDQTNGMGGTTPVTTTADNRLKYIYYFTPNGSDYTTDGLGYKKYVDTYGNRVAEMTKVKLNRSLWGYNPEGSENNFNDYDKLIFSGGSWDSRCSIGVRNNAQTLYQDALAPILFIPGTKLTVKVVVNYDIVTADVNLKDGAGKPYSISHQEIAKQVNFRTPILMNRVHALYIHLGLTSIKLDAVVEAFSNENRLDTEESNGTDITAEIEDAPISPNEVPNP